MIIILIAMALCFSALGCPAQEKKINELDFLIGTWQTREVNAEKTWWETSDRKIKYVLGGNYIEIKATAQDSNGREREYAWYINYNKKSEQFQMVSMFSNWHKTQFSILDWDDEKRILTIRSRPGSEDEFSERFGELVFEEDLRSYIWTGENRYGDKNEPKIWKYTETGTRTN